MASPLEALVARWDLAPQVTRKLAKLAQVVAEDPNAPTTIVDPTRVVQDHLADSLVALDLPEVRSAGAIVDIGSGAGFPGLPLAAALPSAEVVLLDSSRRKCDFLHRAVRACEIENAEVAHARAEDWPDGLGRFDLATVRAVAGLDVLAEYAAPLLRVGGLVLAWRGRRDANAEEAGRRAAGLLGLDVSPPLPVVPYPGVQNRHLHPMRKLSPTPPGFPRRPGRAIKYPLGAGLSASESDRAPR